MCSILPKIILHFVYYADYEAAYGVKVDRWQQRRILKNSYSQQWIQRQTNSLVDCVFVFAMKTTPYQPL